MPKLNINYELTKENILSKNTQASLAKHILGIDDSRTRFSIKSPIRKEGSEDKRASFQIDIDPSGTFLWYDHGIGIGGDLFDLIAIKEKFTFPETLEHINDEMGYGLLSHGLMSAGKKKEYKENSRIISNTIISGQQNIFIPQKKVMSIKEIEYWLDYGISLKTLKEYNVSSCEKVYIAMRYQITSTIRNPIFCYEQKSFDKEKEVKRIYRPKEKTYPRFLGNATMWDLQGIEQLPKSKHTLIISKSLKDVMVLKTMDVTAVAPHSETTGIPKQIFDMLSSRFKNIIIWFDDDEGGRAGIKKIQEQTGLSLKTIQTPRILGAKDISDVRKKHGSRKTNNVINAYIKRYEQ